MQGESNLASSLFFLLIYKVHSPFSDGMQMWKATNKSTETSKREKGEWNMKLRLLSG